MNKKQIQEQIDNFEKIKSVSKDQSEINFCDVKIARLQKELEKASSKTDSSKKRKTELSDDIDFDFEKKTDPKILGIKKRQTKKSITEDFAGLY